MKILELCIDKLPKLLYFGHVEYKKPWSHFTRITDELIIYFVISGELHITEGDIRHSLNKGDILILEPGIEHKGFKSASCYYFFVHFYHDDFRFINIENTDALSAQLNIERNESLNSRSWMTAPDDNSIVRISTFLEDKSDNLKQLLIQGAAAHNNKEEYYKRYSASILNCILIELSRHTTDILIKKANSFTDHTESLNEAVIAFLKKEYMKKLDSDTISKEFQVNYDYLNRIFKKYTGSSIGRYLARYRVDKAKELLVSSDLNFYEIGSRVGYDDPHYFSKLFKKNTGMTLTQFRENAKKAQRNIEIY